MATEPQILSSLSPVYAHLLFCRGSTLTCFSVENPVIYVPIRHYICREPSTNQLLFMQNKANFRKSQMNVNIYYTRNYENKSNRTLGQNKPNSNPIKPNFRKAQMNVNSLITKDYIKYDDFAVRKNKPNSNPISVKPKMSANSLLAKDYENETAFRLQKNKPNSNPISSKAKMNLKLLARKSGHTPCRRKWNLLTYAQSSTLRVYD